MTAKDYIPFGESWKKEVMKMKKADIVEMLADVSKHRLELFRKIGEMKTQCIKIQNFIIALVFEAILIGGILVFIDSLINK